MVLTLYSSTAGLSKLAIMVTYKINFGRLEFKQGLYSLMQQREIKSL